MNTISSLKILSLKHTPRCTALSRSTKSRPEHYAPAVREGIRRQNAEIDAIIRNPEVPTFANTVLAYEKSGEMLHRVGTVFGNLLSAETNDDLQELAKEIMPMMSEHENNISLNEELFARIKAVYEQQDKETLTRNSTSCWKIFTMVLYATAPTSREKPRRNTVLYAKSSAC